MRRETETTRVTPDRPTISIIIVSYNTRRMTLECLRTLYAGLGELTAEVWLVDNASQDGSADAVAEGFPAVRLIRNFANKGFAAANNQAMQLAAGEYFLLLNSDAFVAPGAVAALLAYLRSHSEVGMVGPRLSNEDGSLQRSCFRFPTPARAWLENLWVSALLPGHWAAGDYRRWPHDSERRVDWVIGACLLVRREVFEQVGGFDERFFMYAEETDWQRRIRDRGWDIGFTPAAVVTHLGGASGAREKARINRHFFDSLDFYERKHHGLRGLVALRAAMVLGCCLRAPLWAAAGALPRLRAVARSKVRLLCWLIVRQATHWRLKSVGGAHG